MSEKLSDEDVAFLKGMIKDSKSSRRESRLAQTDVERLKELLQKQQSSNEPKLTHEFIQELSDLVDMSPQVQEALLSWSLTMMAWEKILLSKGLITKEEIEQEALKLKKEMPQQHTREFLKQQLEEAAAAYR
jgi:hypothetical protein